MQSFFRTLCSLIILACATDGHAAAVPTTLVVGFQAGGGLDSVARALANEINSAGENKLIVENKPGASGIIAIDAVRNSKAQNPMLVIMPSGSITMTPHTNKNFKYDPKHDLIPVARLATYSLGLAVSPHTQAANLEEYLTKASQSSSLAAYGTAGIGLSPHYIGEMISRESKVKLIHVPYKGAGPAINDALGGQIPAVISTVPSLLPALRDGRLNLLATTGAERDEYTPDVPTLKELGYKGLEIKEWFGVFAPASASPETVQRWNTAINRALESNTLRKTLISQGFVPAPMSSQDFWKTVIDDYDRWGAALRNSGDTFSN